jgi:hypothetical protein
LPEATPPPAAHPIPPQIEDAALRLGEAIASVQGIPLDPLTASWQEIESGVIKLLLGAFKPDNPAHQDIAFMLAAAFSQRLRRDFGAFWFPSRSARHGAALGFPDGIIVFSPFEAVEQALARARLGSLEDITGELRGVLAQARARPADIPAGAELGSERLGPEDYRRLFDPGLVQFVALDREALDRTLGARPESLIRDLEQAFSRLPPEVPEQIHKPTRRRLLEAMKQLNPLSPLREQAARAPQLAELLALLFAGKAETGFAPAELWSDVLIPLGHIGTPGSFPALDEDGATAFRSGVDPLLLYVDAVPYQQPAADEDGLLGTFSEDQVALLDAGFEGATELRLLGLAPEALRSLWGTLDPGAVKAAIERFRRHCETTAGPATPPSSAPPPAEPTLLDVAMSLLDNATQLMKAMDGQNLMPCLRQATESEASSEPMMRALRKAHAAPRIILA